MALFPCPDCKNMVSPIAASCPKCGRILKQLRPLPPKTSGCAKLFVAGILILFVVIPIGGYVIKNLIKQIPEVENQLQEEIFTPTQRVQRKRHNLHILRCANSNNFARDFFYATSGIVLRIYSSDKVLVDPKTWNVSAYEHKKWIVNITSLYQESHEKKPHVILVDFSNTNHVLAEGSPDEEIKIYP